MAEPGGLWDTTIFPKIVGFARAVVPCFGDRLQFRGVSTQCETNLARWKFSVGKVKTHLEGL